MLKDLLKKSRSIRRFYEDDPVPEEMIRDWVDNVRYTPSTANGQTLKFRICTSQEDREKIFPNLKWAGALPDWDGPEEGERPSAYIIVLCDNTLGKNKQTDVGITSQTMMLGAVEMGYGGCMLGNVRRTELAKHLSIDSERFTIELVLALGKPKETVKIVDIPENGSVKYYRDQDQVHYVPKRHLEDVLV